MSDHQRRWALGAAALGYLVLTALLTWPTIANFSRALAGFKGLDSLQYTWSLWWTRWAWGRLGSSPAEVTLLNHPWGGHHGLLTVTPLLDWLALPLYTLINPTEVYNLLFLLSFVLTGTTMYLFALDLTGSPLAAFFAGSIFSFFPNRMGHALSGHLTQLSAWWFPLYLRYLLRAFRLPTKGDTLRAALFLVLSMEMALVQTAYFVVPATVLVLAHQLITHPGQVSHRHYRAGALLFGLATVCVLPTYGPFLWNAWSQGVSLAAPGAIDHSVDVLALLSPSPYHPWWGSIFGRFGALQQLFPEPNELEHSAFLGWIPLLLGLRAVLRREKGTGLWLTVGLASLWLSLGPVLRVAGKTTALSQPYAFLMRLPIFRWGRTPERFNELTMLGVSLLAAQGLAGLTWRQLAKAALIGLALIEMLVLWPFPSGTSKPPPSVASWESEPGAALNLPISKRQIGNLAMYYQTVHGRPIVGGYIHRDLPGARRYAKAVDAALTAQYHTASRPLTPAELRGWLVGLDIGHVVLHHQFVTAEWTEGVSSRLRAALGPPTTDTGSELIFEVPSRARPSTDLASFSDTITLSGIQVDPAVLGAGRPTTVTLWWRASAVPDSAFHVFVHLLDHGGTRVAQQDGQPLGGNWPTALWAPHQTLVDQHSLQLPTTLSHGRYHLAVGLYEASSGNRLPVRSSAGHVSEEGMWVLSDALEVEEGDSS